MVTTTPAMGLRQMRSSGRVSGGGGGCSTDAGIEMAGLELHRFVGRFGKDFDVYVVFLAFKRNSQFHGFSLSGRFFTRTVIRRAKVGRTFGWFLRGRVGSRVPGVFREYGREIPGTAATAAAIRIR